MKELGYKKIWCEVWKLNDKQTGVFLATINRLRGIDDLQKRVRLIGEIYKDFGEDKAILLRLLPETEKSLNALLKMVEADVQMDVEELEIERGLVEDQLNQIVDPEEAERMANVYKSTPDGKLRLCFIFDNIDLYRRARKFFYNDRGEPDTDRLMSFINYARKHA